MERTPKGKKKNRVASVFCIILTCILLIETAVLGYIWIPEIIRKNTHDSTLIVMAPDNPGLEASEEAAAIVLRQYIYARLLEEKVARYEENADNFSEFEALVNQTANAWNLCGIYCDTLTRMSDVLSAEESKQEYTPTYGDNQIVCNEEIKIQDPFAITAQAKGKSKELLAAETLTRVFDKGENGKKLKYLADYMGTDVKTAKEAFDNAQALIYDGAAKDADWYNKCYYGCKIAATTGKVCAVVASGGAAGWAMSSGLVIAGADAVVSVANTTCDITLGSDHAVTKALDKTEEVTGILAAGSGVAGLKGANSTDKILTLTGMGTDLAQGKIIGGAVDMDLTGEVKVCTFTVSEDQTENWKKQSEKEMIENIRQRFKKYDGKDVFTTETAKKISQGIETLTDESPSNNNTDLSSIPDEQLDKLLEENTPDLTDEEIMQIMNDLEEELNEAVEHDEMTGLTKEDYPVLSAPTVYDVEGAWEITLSLSNIGSKLVDNLAAGIDAAFGEGASEDVLEYHYDKDSVQSVNLYMNVEPVSDKKAKVTMISVEDGEWYYSEYDGTMDNGTMTLKLKSYESNLEVGISQGMDKLVFDFYGYGDERYIQGTCDLKSYVASADIDYVGQRVDPDGYWEFTGE